jgi:DNA polymerase V
MLTGLSNANDKTNLFSSEKDEKINSLMRSIDNTNHRYGKIYFKCCECWCSKEMEYEKRIFFQDRYS